MKTTKFTLDFKDLNLKSIVHNSARKAGKSLNQYILDCVLGDDSKPLFSESSFKGVKLTEEEALAIENGTYDNGKKLNLSEEALEAIAAHADNCPCLMYNPKKDV